MISRWPSFFDDRFTENVPAPGHRGCCLIAGLAALVLWLPNDVDSGLIEKVRRRYQIGDMLAPMVALATILLGGGWLLPLKGPAANR